METHPARIGRVGENSLVGPQPSSSARQLARLWIRPSPRPLGNGVREYGDYDGADARGARYFWMLTRPREEAEPVWRALDVHGYGGAFVMTS